MGREASCICRVKGESASVKALLESSEIVLRGALKRRIEFASLSDVRVVASSLHFKADGQSYELELGAEEAQKWAKKLTTPPPSLATKLGLGSERRALVVGPVKEPELVEALRDRTTSDPKVADFLVAVVATDDDLRAALGRHARMSSPVAWIVHPKGKAATFGEAAVRALMRASGYMDNKVSAVSAGLTATRYRRTS